MVRPEPLPEGLAEPLHLLPPWLPEVLFWSVVVALVAALFLWWLWRRIRRAKDAVSTPLSAPSAVVVGGLAKRIQALRKRFLELGKPRDGCHALAGELRTHLEQRSGLAVEEMTVDEIRRRFQSRKIGQFFFELRAKQFARNAPSDNDFARLSRRALNLFADKRKYKLRNGD